MTTASGIRELEAPRFRVVLTWVDLPCGCSRSDRGSWILSGRCPDGHHGLLDPEQLADWHRFGRETQFGPFVPDVREALRGPRPSDSSASRNDTEAPLAPRSADDPAGEESLAGASGLVAI